MIFGKKRGVISLLIASCVMFTAEFEVLAANPQTEAQVIVTLNYETEEIALAKMMEEVPAMASIAVDTQAWYGKALANTDSQIYMYAEATEQSKKVAIMKNNTVVTVDEVGAEWTKVTSGTLTGYVKNELLLTGAAAVERAKVTCVNGQTEATACTQAAVKTYNRGTQDVPTETLLAALIYCEAGNQPYEGKVGVGAVVMNRVASSRFPNNIREVIYQRGQFTPAMSGKVDRTIASGRIPASCYEAARAALAGETTVGNAMYFNTGYGSFKLGDHYFS